jgi:predicted ATPase
MSKVNPNRERAKVNDYKNLSLPDKAIKYPRFFNSIRFDHFRHISNVELKFVNPITVISGSNCSGKTTTLMAIACSHYHFMRRNVVNGTWERTRWGDLMRFTSHDVQLVDWTYYVTYRDGVFHSPEKRGQHKTTGKWNGVAKKEGQIGTPASDPNGRKVYLIDLNRIIPGRHLSRNNYLKARGASATDISNKRLVNAYVSYIFERTYQVKSLFSAADSQLFAYIGGDCYSSFNTASGEDVVLAMLTDIVNAEENSLVLIDEIEMGLHPKLQRRLMDVLFRISRIQKKQFIITTHSYAILDSVLPESRLYIDNCNGVFRVIDNVPTKEVLTRMDSERFPVLSVYVEDYVSKRIVMEAVKQLNSANAGLARLLTVVEIGAADKTYLYFKKRREVGPTDHFERRAVCILDGDMRAQTNRDGSYKYPPDSDLFFHFSNMPPEMMLVKKYLVNHPNPSLQYHVGIDGNAHILFEKMRELGIAVSKEDALEMCLPEYLNSVDGGLHFEQLKSFIQQKCQL